VAGGQIEQRRLDGGCWPAVLCSRLGRCVGQLPTPAGWASGRRFGQC
jgi:hypothetical protein